MLPVILSADTVVAGRCHHRLNKFLLLLMMLMPLWSLRICLPLFLRLAISRYNPHVGVEEAESAGLDLSTRVEQGNCIV